MFLNNAPFHGMEFSASKRPRLEKWNEIKMASVEYSSPKISKKSPHGHLDVLPLTKVTVLVEDELAATLRPNLKATKGKWNQGK